MTENLRPCLLLLLSLLVACASSPDVEYPELPYRAPTDWSAAAGTEIRPGTAGAGKAFWWEEFGDPRLTALLQEALIGNPDLRATAARVARAAAQASIAGADSYPRAGLSAEGSRSRQNFVGLPIPGSTGIITNRFNSFGVSLDISWEIDLWGRLRAGHSAAIADSEAAWIDLQGAYLSLLGQVSKAWFAAVEARQQVRLAEVSVETYRDTHQQVETRFDRGLRPARDVRLAKSNLSSAEADLASRRRLEDRARRQLEILVGRYPAALVEAAGTLPTLDARVPSYLPADIVSHRPDLASLERRVAASRLRVDQARAALYPRISLTASGGTSSNELGDLVDGDFSVWRIAANAMQPLFQGGRLLAGIDVAEAGEHEALAQWVSATLRAYSEVESSLAAEAWLAESEASLRSASSEANAASDSTLERYSRGLDDIVTLLTAQRTAVQAESRLLDVQRQRLEARIDLHLALGGGFQNTRPDHSASASSDDPETDSPETSS